LATIKIINEPLTIGSMRDERFTPVERHQPGEADDDFEMPEDELEDLLPKKKRFPKNEEFYTAS